MDCNKVAAAIFLRDCAVYSGQVSDCEVYRANPVTVLAAMQYRWSKTGEQLLTPQLLKQSACGQPMIT